MIKMIERNKIWIKSILIKLADKYGIDAYRRSAWSQEGEDLILTRLFENVLEGYYVDIGAHHPTRFSNTYKFYRRGWSGINIDARPGTKELFDRFRPRDINIEIGIGSVKESLKYYMFEDPAYNGFDPELSSFRASSGVSRIIAEREIQVIALGDILDSVIPKETQIDFMSVDVEGFDYQVLRSNNWEKYRPSYVLVEIIGGKLLNLESFDIHNLLCGVGYEVYAKTHQTFIYKKSDS